MRTAACASTSGTFASFPSSGQSLRQASRAVGYFPGLQGAAVYQQRLFSHSFVCIVRKNHPRIGSQITKKQFLEQALAGQSLARRVALSVPHFLALPLIIAESDLVVTVPYAVATSFAKMTELRVLRPPIQVPRADVKQHWHARFHHDKANKWIRGVIAALFVETPRRPRT